MISATCSVGVLLERLGKDGGNVDGGASVRVSFDAAGVIIEGVIPTHYPSVPGIKHEVRTGPTVVLIYIIHSQVILLFFIPYCSSNLHQILKLSLLVNFNRS